MYYFHSNRQETLKVTPVKELWWVFSPSGSKEQAEVKRAAGCTDWLVWPNSSLTAHSCHSELSSGTSEGLPPTQ